jgi:hypothetical protein
MPADGVLDIDLACRRGSLCISQVADLTMIVAAACHPAVCVVPGGPRPIPVACTEVPMSADGVR